MRLRIIIIIISLFTTQLFAQEVASDSLLLTQLNIAAHEDDLNDAISHTYAIYKQALRAGYQNSLEHSLQQLTDLYVKQKNTIQSLRYSLEHLAILEDGDPIKYSLVNEQIGDIYQSEKIYSAALNYYKQAVFSQNPTENHLRLLEKTGAAFINYNQLDSAAVYYHKSLTIHRKSKNYHGEVKTLQQLAKIYDLNDHCKAALQYYQSIERLIINNDDDKELATLYNNIGYQHHCLEDYKNAIEYFELAFSLCEKDCTLDKITLYTNLGIAHFNHQTYFKATQNIQEGIAIAKQTKDTVRLSSLENLLANIFYEKGEFYEALVHNNKALDHSKRAHAHHILKNACLTEANIYERLYEYDKALSFYQQHLQLRDSLLLDERLRKEKLLQQQFTLESAEKEIKLLLINQKVQDLAFEQLALEKNNLELAAYTKEKELALLRSEQENNKERLRVEELQALKAKQELSLTQQRLLAAQKDGQILGLEQKEAQQALELSQRKADELAQQQQIQLLNNEKSLQQAKLDKQETNRKHTNRILAGLSAIVLILLIGYKKLRDQKKKIESQKEAIEAEKVKSEQLLLNILPKETAKELLDNGFAQPKHYDKVTVLFADFENFTKLAERLSPNELIEELNTCFIAFDEITSQHGLEKIKTIGDAYMCAGGIPVANECNAQNAVDAAREMMDFIEKRHQEKQDNNQPFWRMRIGIHTGAVVAGVVGSKKFAYDIWGDTVNIAARMESNSIPGRINISQSTFDELPEQYACESRGKLAMKNKADAEMFFVST